MPRIPDVCSSVFCLLVNVLRIGVSAFCKLFRLSNRRAVSYSWRSIPSAVCLLFFLVSHTSLLAKVSAQGASATLSGTMTDQTAAAVPGVNIALISTAQGFEQAMLTNGEGPFVVLLLPPGNYTVKAEYEGFRPAEGKDVILNVNDQRLIDIRLKAGTLKAMKSVLTTSDSLQSEGSGSSSILAFDNCFGNQLSTSDYSNCGARPARDHSCSVASTTKDSKKEERT